MLWERTLSLSGNRHARLQHLEPVEDEVELLSLGRGFIGVHCRTFLEHQEAALETERGIVAETPRMLFEGPRTRWRAASHPRSHLASISLVADSPTNVVTSSLPECHSQ